MALFKKKCVCWESRCWITGGRDPVWMRQDPIWVRWDPVWVIRDLLWFRRSPGWGRRGHIFGWVKRDHFLDSNIDGILNTMYKREEMWLTWDHLAGLHHQLPPPLRRSYVHYNIRFTSVDLGSCIRWLTPEAVGTTQSGTLALVCKYFFLVFQFYKKHMLKWSCCSLHRVVVNLGRQMLTTANMRSLKPRAKADNMVNWMYYNYFDVVSCLKLIVELV